MPGAIRPMPGRRGFLPGSAQRLHRNGHHVFFNTPCLAPNWVNPLCFPFGFPSSGFGFGGFPFVSYPYVYPPIFGMDYSSYESQPIQQQPQTVYVQQENPGLQDEVSRLADQVERLTEQQAQQRAPAPPATSRQSSVPTTLVYRDGRRSEVENYAIVGQTLWIFSETHARKVPMSDLNLPATRAANEQRGVEFLGPK